MKHLPLLLLPFLLFTACNTEPSGGGDQRPNILLILADDMGYSDIGCYGGEIQTPALDQLAAGGLRFTNFYNAARCCPTRASLLTGLYPHQAGVGLMVYGPDRGGGYRGFLNRNSVTLAEVLQRAGYKTMMSGKWHVGHREGQWPTDRGFERFYGIHIHVDSYYKVLEGCDVYLDGELHIPDTSHPVNQLRPAQDWYTTDVFTDYALHFLDEEVAEQEDDRPFFMYLAYNAPHWPLEAPDEDIEKYRGKYRSGWEALRREKFSRMQEMGILKPEARLSPVDLPDWDSLSQAEREDLDFRRAIYAAQIDRMDQNIGRVVEHLQSIGEYENTLILFLSDNGCSAEPEDSFYGYKWKENTVASYPDWKEESARSSSQGLAWATVSNAPFQKYKKWTHEGGIATPLIAHWPGKIKNPGGFNRNSGHLVDIMTTLVEVAGAEYPANHSGNAITAMEGRSLLPYLQNGDRESHEYLFWEHMGNRAVRQGDWKLVAESGRDWELYNLAEDPTELNNLVEDYPEKAAAFKAAYAEWAERSGVRPWPLE